MASAPAYNWNIETVDSSADIYTDSIALDASGNPHIAYCVMSDVLNYASWTDSGWNIETVDSGNVGSCSLAIDPSGYPHISYHDGANGDLKYAHWTGSNWSIETVDNAGDAGLFTSIALDASGYPRISYSDFTYDYDLKYASWKGSGWNIETVDSAGNVGLCTSLALDASGNPHISYYRLYDEPVNRGDLKYAHWTGSNWNVQVVDTGVLAVEGSSIALDASGNPHISYEGWVGGLGVLEYAHWTGSGWNTEIVDRSRYDSVGRYSSIAIDASGYPHISYMGLNYAHWTGNAWSITTVDSGGAYTSIALDDNGCPHICYSYYMGLKYAKGPPNTAPILSSGSVNPTSGNTTNTFTYEVTYTDTDEDPPSYIKVYIDDVGYSMRNIFGTYSGGALYRYTTTLGAGSHIYYFSASDGTATARLPSSSTYSGPSVTATNIAPSLISGSVFPTSGTTDTTFTYEVTYSDANGDAPSYVRVYIDGTWYSMTNVSGTYTSGALYRYTTNSLDTSSHNYYFGASDGIDTISLPPSGINSGPIVTGPSPPSHGTSPWIYVGAVAVVVVIIAAVLIIKFV